MIFTNDEKREILSLVRKLRASIGSLLKEGDEGKLFKYIKMS